MHKCNFCGEDVDLPYSCNQCGRKHCPDHRLPEKHSCIGLSYSGRRTKHFESEFDDSIGDRPTRRRDNRQSNTHGSSNVSPRPDDQRSIGDSSPDLNPDGSLASRSRLLPRDDVHQPTSWLVHFGFIREAIQFVRLKHVLGLAILAFTLLAFTPLSASLIFPGEIGAQIDDTVAGVERDSHEMIGSIANVTESGHNQERIERSVHEKVNDQRTANGLRPLEHDSNLRNVARYHSEDMTKQRYFAHESPGGENFADRYSKFGVSCRVSTGSNSYASGAENIAKFSFNHYMSEEELANRTVTGWMNSPGHRENILKPYWQTEGIGVAITERDGKTVVHITQNFC